MKNRTTRNAKTSHTGKRNSEFSFGSGKPYADNEEYASKGLLFDILDIAFETGRGYEGRDRWALTVNCADREPEIMTLGSNPKRDEQLREAQTHLKRGGSLKNVRLRESGNAYYLADANR